MKHSSVAFCMIQIVSNINHMSVHIFFELIVCTNGSTITHMHINCANEKSVKLTDKRKAETIF